ncbi:MAG: hypothetical protein HC945_03200 [Nitrosarchaeum sp.]|nr:hypothetical protein [Nitrosarchaeum sp.]
MKTIILDTNFLLVPGQVSLDIFEEIQRIMDEPYELAVLQGTLTELTTLSTTGKQIDQRAARLALQLIKHKALKIIPGSEAGYVDDLLVEKAQQNVVVATMDAALRRRILAKGSAIIGVRQKTHLYLRR